MGCISSRITSAFLGYNPLVEEAAKLERARQHCNVFEMYVASQQPYYHEQPSPSNRIELIVEANLRRAKRNGNTS